MTTLPAGDLFALTAALIDIPSVSHDEQAITAILEAELRTLAHLTVDRVGDNLIARTELGREWRLVLGGHTDTVPPDGNEHAVIDGDRLSGVGATDMKGGIATMLELARTVTEPAVDITYVFYAREEVAVVHNGLREIEEQRPELLNGDVALLGEPTLGAIEAGCQGTMRFEVTLVGARSHTARPWMGRNAIHRLGVLLAILDTYVPREPVIEGCAYREALQAVHVEGGVAGNVVPDRAMIRINHRFAPDRTVEEAEGFVRELLDPALAEEDQIVVVDASPAALPGLADPLLQSLVTRSGLEVRAKLGWTDVAFFSALGVPASNFGPGDPTMAHTAGEYVERAWLDDTYAALVDLLTHGV
ncbi:MAG: succinyl-diaminopimelate desuccinylase [Acidimicrobiales bacterium]|jgi:succinyl-diaminopimelate desuccinylase|nr:succinyl-diaminopimelate desuccinylase [Acidimicrobiales bacterium]